MELNLAAITHDRSSEGNASIPRNRGTEGAWREVALAALK
jgi:hypothetical protein